MLVNDPNDLCPLCVLAPYIFPARYPERRSPAYSLSYQPMTPLRDVCDRRLKRARPVLKPQALIHKMDQPAVSPKEATPALGFPSALSVKRMNQTFTSAASRSEKDPKLTRLSEQFGLPFIESEVKRPICQ